MMPLAYHVLFRKRNYILASLCVSMQLTRTQPNSLTYIDHTVHISILDGLKLVLLEILCYSNVYTLY
jgi:hypothetical protein